MRRLAAALLLLGSLPAAAWAEGVSVRTGNHPGFGRVVFDMPPGAEFRLVEEASRAIVVFTGVGEVPSPPPLPRNVVALQGGAGAATLVFKPGARVRASRMGDRVVVDAYDPASGKAAGPPVRRAVAEPPAKAPAPTAPVATEAAGVPQPAAPAVTDARPPTVLEAAPVAAAAVPETAPPPAPERRTTMLIPVATDVGAAAFRRGSYAVVVLDGRVDGGTQGLDGTGPLGAIVTEGHASVVVSFPLPPSLAPKLTRTEKGWMLGTMPAPDGSSGQAEPGVFKIGAPGRVVSVLDPVTEQPLLVGTSRQAGGEGVGTGQRAPGYAVLPTWMGVAVEPLSDQVRLLPTDGGFKLEALPAAVAQAAAPLPDLSLTRQFDLPALAVPAHLNRLHAQVAGAAAAPARGRGPARLAVAHSMVSLGLGAEAQAVLAVLAAEDPAMAAQADVAGLAAIAALLAGRMEEAGGLDDPRLDGTDEIGLWRAVRASWRSGEPQAEPMLRALPLVLAYPEALKARLLPTVLEAAAQQGLAQAELAKHAGPALDYARALQAERDGDAGAALALLDRLALSRDLLTQVKASARAAEVRFASGQADAGQTAKALDNQVFAWRGDGREVALRLRVAELRAKAGAWRVALDGLRDAAGVAAAGADAAAVPRIAGWVADVFRAMLAPGAPPVPPLDLVTLAAEFADQLPGGADGTALRMLLAEKLGSLDLPARAQAVVRPLMLAAPPGPVRAGLGAVLAGSLLDGGDAVAAQAALSQSEAPDMPMAVRDGRSFMLARVHAAAGRVPEAVATLAALGAPAADALRARLLEGTGNWRGTQAALADLSRKLIPAAGPLDAPMQDLVLRQASAAVQAGDDAALQGLREAYAARMALPRLDMLRLLTAPPVSGSGDLPRAGSDIALARAIPRGLQAMKAP